MKYGISVSVSVGTRRSDDLYTGASPDGDGVEAERWPLLVGVGAPMVEGSKEMGRGRLEVLVGNAWRTHDGRRGGEGCYDARRGVLHRDPRASPWPFRVKCWERGKSVVKSARGGGGAGQGGCSLGETERTVTM